LIIILAPGADVFLLLRVSVSHGVPSGLGALGGIHLGNAIQAALMISGIGLVVSRIPMALTVLEVVGALYLLYLAASSIRAVRRGPGPTVSEGADKQGPPKISSPFLQGLVANLTNPKVLIFFIAFFPQFIGNSTSAPLQLLVLSAVFIGIAVIREGIIVFGAGTMGKTMNSARFTQVMDAICAIAFTFLAVFILGSLA
jgi:threonine/homoserine/homoserine lactone efflux protein